MAVEIIVSPLISVNPQKEPLWTQSWSEIGSGKNLFGTRIPLCPGDSVSAHSGKGVQDKIEGELPPITLTVRAI